MASCRRNKLSFCLLLLACLHCAHGFFIDLEALGFSKSSEDSYTNSGRDDAKLLVAAPSEQQLVEVESKTDPNKSVKLTLGELKQLILGSVKDMTPNPPPINIKISGIKDTFSKYAAAAMTTTSTERPMKVNKYKYKNPVVTITDPYEDTVPSSDMEDEQVVSSYWNKNKRPTMSYEDINLYSNEVTPSKGVMEEDEGWFSAAKSALRRPVNSMSRWRNSDRDASKKNKQRGRRPIQDITYSHNENRERGRRRKRPPPSRSRRPSGRRPLRRGNQKRRRGPPPSSSHRNSASSYSYADDPEFYGEYDGGSYYGGGDWDRMGVSSYDSNFPKDDVLAMNMSPPMPPPQPNHNHY